MKDNIYLSIITLSKNDNDKFLRTLNSIKSQKNNYNIEWLIIDGSDYRIQEEKLNLIKINLNGSKRKYILINFVDSNKKGIKGIYSCMNYGKKTAKGKFVLFLNSGDTFFNDNSLKIILGNSLELSKDYSMIFGQAKIIASPNLSWIFPGKRLKNFAKWLDFFEPNHQSMIISRTLSNKYDFQLNYGILSDGYWKRLIIKNAVDIVYIKTPIINFYLDGVSSIKPTKKTLIEIFENKNINIIRKIIFFIKFIFPKNIYIFYFKIQKLKALIIDLIFF